MKSRKVIPASASPKNPPQRRCSLCDRVFALSEALALRTLRGRVRLHCPTLACRSTSKMWVHPGNPLTSEEAWQDWERMFAWWDRRLRDQDSIPA